MPVKHQKRIPQIQNLIAQREERIYYIILC